MRKPLSALLRLNLGVLASGVFTSCLLEPADGEAVCGKDTILEFSGFVTNPGASVTVQAAATLSGAYSDIAVATSASSAAFTADGVTYYGWQVYAAVPAWSSVSGQYEAYARATSGGNLLTFSSSPGYFPCIDSRMTAGETFTAAAYACRSPNSPIAKLTAPLSPAAVTLNADVVVASMADAARYGCLSRVNGNVDINADVPAASGLPTEAPITLPYLAVVAARASSPGNVSLRYLRGGTLVSPRLARMPLRTVAGSLTIATPTGSNIDFGLPSLTTVGANLSLDYYNAVARGLPALARVPGNLSVRNQTDVLGAAGLLPALTEVGGNLDVQYGFQLDGLLDSVRSVGGDVAVSRDFGPADHVGTLNSLKGLVSVGGNLVVSRASFTQSSVVFPHLTSVAGSVTIGGSKFLNLNLGADPVAGAPSLSIGSLIVRENPKLSAIVPGRVRVNGSGPVVFLHNLCLPRPDIDAFFSELTGFGWSGTGTNSDNGHDCAP